MKTLRITRQVERSLVGGAAFSARFPAVPIGKMAATLRKSEDGLGLTRCGFFDPTVPIEINLVHSRLIRERLAQIEPLLADAPSALLPSRLVGARPAVGYVPPELLSYPNPVGLSWLERLGPASRRVARLRSTSTDAEFWSRVAARGVYAPWVEELCTVASGLNAALMAPPVAVISRDLPSAPRLQAELNLAFADLLTTRQSSGSPGALYSLHVHPNALSDGHLLSAAVTALSRVLTEGDNPFWGVHLNLYDLSLLTARHERVQAAKEFTAEVARVASDQDVFVWASDVGPVGPALLDLGVSFTGYRPGMTPIRVYPGPMAPSGDLIYGKVLGLWHYNLYGFGELRERGWRLDDTGLFPNVVPPQVRTAAPEVFRINFGKPNNIAVAERLNQLREVEVGSKGNGRPGTSHLSRSQDARIAPWC